MILLQDPMFYYYKGDTRYNPVACRRRVSASAPRVSLAHGVDDAVELVEAGHAAADELAQVVGEEFRPVFGGYPLDVVDGCACRDHLADPVVELHYLVDCDSSAVAHMVAFRATDGLVAFRDALVLEQCALGAGEGVLAFAIRAQPFHQPLGDDCVDGRGHQVRRDAHVDESDNGGHRVVGVQGREHQVTRDGRTEAISAVS